MHTTAEGDIHLRRECLPIAAPSDIAFVLRVFHVEQRVQELLIAAIIRVGTLQQDEDGRADYLLAFPPEYTFRTRIETLDLAAVLDHQQAIVHLADHGVGGGNDVLQGVQDGVIAARDLTHLRIGLDGGAEGQIPG